MKNESVHHPPEGSSISLKITPAKVRYAWNLEPSGKISNESWASVFYLILSIIVMVYVLNVLINSKVGGTSIDEGIHFGHVFVWVFDLMIVLLILRQSKAIYDTLRGGIPAGLIIMANQIDYSTGCTREQLKFGPRGKVEQEQKEKTEAKPKSYIISKKELEDLALERIEGYLRLSIKHRGKTIEIGSTLDDSDKEWLYRSLRERINQPQMLP